MWLLVLLEFIAGLGQMAADAKRYRAAAIVFLVIAIVLFAPALFGLSVGNAWGVVLFGLIASPFAILSWLAWKRARQAGDGAV